MTANKQWPPPTADGEPMDPDRTYHFFDRKSCTVVTVDGFLDRPVGMPIIPTQLRESKDDALEDGEKFFVAEIDKLRESIREFEGQKSAGGKTLKYLLMARG